MILRELREIDQATDDILVYGFDGTANKKIKTNTDGKIDIVSDNLDIALSTLKTVLDAIDSNTDTLEAKTQSIRDQLDVLLSSRASESTSQSILQALGEASGTDLLNELQNIFSKLGDISNIDFATETTLLEVRDSLDTVETKLQTIIDTLDVNLSTRASETTLSSVLSQLDITLSALRDALKGSGNKDFTTLEADVESILAQIDVALSSRSSESTSQGILNALGEGSGTNLLVELQNVIERLGEVIETPTQHTVLDRLKVITDTLVELLSPSVTGALEIERFGSILMEEGFANDIFDTINRWTETIVGGATQTVSGASLILDVTTANSDSVLETFNQIDLVGTIGAYVHFSAAVKYGDTLVTNNIREFGIKNISGDNGLFFRISGSSFYLVVLKNSVETLHDITSSLPDSDFHTYDFNYLDSQEILIVIDAEPVLTLSGSDALIGDKVKIPFMRNYNTALLGQVPSSTIIQWLHLVDLAGTKFAITGKDDSGFVREVAVSPTRRMLVSQEPPTPPPATTSVKITEYDTVSGTADNVYVIPIGETLILQRLSCSAETDTVSGNVVELWYDPNGTGVGMTIIDAIFTSANAEQHDLNESYVGDGTVAIRLRRKRLSGGSKDIFGRWEGYY